MAAALSRPTDQRHFPQPAFCIRPGMPGGSLWTISLSQLLEAVVEATSSAAERLA